MGAHYIEEIDVSDVAQFAWAGLRRFENTQVNVALIRQRQSPPASQSRNVRKQAEQIRYCILQARQYYDAAQAVSAAIRPVLLYYMVMSLALAEALSKQDGSSSLDALRAEHANHGLDFSQNSSAEPKEQLAEAATVLRAKPIFRRAGKRVGTFEVWHRSANEDPVGGVRTTTIAEGTQRSVECLFAAVDECLPPFPSAGVSLLDCYKSMPSMMHCLRTNGIASDVVRGRIVESFDRAAQTSTIRIVTHPARPELVKCFGDAFLVHPNSYEQVSIDEITGGYHVTINQGPDLGELDCKMPPGSQMSSEEIRFFPKTGSLNEFGMFYVSLFILGNYCRYFPDRWMKDVEQSSPLALSCEILMAEAERRVPLLALSELGGRLYMPK